MRLAAEKGLRQMAPTDVGWQAALGLVLAGCATCCFRSDVPLELPAIAAFAWSALALLFLFPALKVTGEGGRPPNDDEASMLGQPMPAGRPVRLLNEDVFRSLRRSAGISDDFLDSGWSFDELRPSAAKGGSPMVFIDDKYVVKEMNASDHRMLLKLTKSYVEHLRAGESLLCTILMHFEDVATRKPYFVMRNAMGGGRVERMFDLKGCDDDKTLVDNGRSVKAVHKRFYNLHLWGGTCCWTEDRVQYFRGKVNARKLQVHISAAEREKVLRAIRRDTEWLAGHGLMDYSLLLGVKPSSAGSHFWSPFTSMASKAPEDNVERHVANVESCDVRFSIIDFLQPWNAKKQAAACFKFLEPNRATVRPVAYARRFLSHFEKALIVPTSCTNTAAKLEGAVGHAASAA
eukprot:TRINITY_DN5649_c0_g1_i1.p1 TRINITY_DN5649_c0_g1~~TRINITY_DN5649_c0_g1_i1.p1  ORF type:complete len:404 (-),score=76.00 TRINITY_DN5649_c0_g1_i1:28-1239(-)